MREIDYITERKFGFFQQPSPNCFCSGAKSECAELAEDDGYSVIDWKAEASALPIEKIKLLDLVPAKAPLKKAVLPSFVNGLKNLENILFNLIFVRNISEDQLPASLRSILLTRELNYEDLIEEMEENPPTWNEKVVLPNLEALKIIGNEEKTELLVNLSPTNFPALKFLAFDIADKSELDIFSRFPQLSDLELLYLKDYDIFERVKDLPLISMDLGGTNNKFDMSSAKNIKTLKFLRLNSVRSEIDCKIFTELPELKELVILNSKKITNIEALLDCEKLVSISFTDCGNPFKKGIADKFAARRYEILDIEYA